MQPMVEGREAPLYHWVGKSKLYNILHEDKMGAWWEHIIPEGNRKVYGNSLTRNKRFVYLDRIGRLTFDQGKLAQTNKIIPLDAEVVFDHTHGGIGIDGITTDRQKAQKSQYSNDYYHKESNIMAEEFVIGDIQPLHNYLIEIAIARSKTRYVMIAQEYAKKYGINIVVM